MKLVEDRRCPRHGPSIIEVHDQAGTTDSEAYAVFNDPGDQPLPFCALCAILWPHRKPKES